MMRKEWCRYCFHAADDTCTIWDDPRKLGKLALEKSLLKIGLELVARGNALPEPCKSQFALDLVKKLLR